jgi:hypothetical protein
VEPLPELEPEVEVEVDPDPVVPLSLTPVELLGAPGPVGS